MLKRLVTLCVAVSLSAALAFAQGPGPRQRGNGTPPDPATMIANRVDFLANALGLSADQKTQATTIFTNALNASQTIQTSLHTAHQSLGDAVKKNDLATIDTLSATIGSATGQLTSINSKADAAFYAILTADQQTKFDSLRRGPGGPGGPGAGRFGPPPPRN